MATTLISNGTSTLKITRPLTTTSGFTSDLDPTVRTHLKELNDLLSKRIFRVRPVNDLVRAKTAARDQAEANAKKKVDAMEQAKMFAAAKETAAADARAAWTKAADALNSAKSGGKPDAIKAAEEAVKAAEGKRKAAETDADKAAKTAQDAEASATAALDAAERAEEELSTEVYRMRSGPAPVEVDYLKWILESPLTPKRARNRAEPWADDSLAYRLDEADESPEHRTLSELNDQKSKVSTLKSAFQEYFAANRFSLDYNIRSVIENHPAILDYLVSVAYNMGFREINALKNFILSSGNGAKRIVKYAAVSAARTIIQQDRLRVNHYDEDNSQIVQDIEKANLTLSTAAFKTKLKGLVNNYIFNRRYIELIEKSDIGPIPAAFIPELVKYIKSYEKKGILIDDNNVNFYLPIFISQIKGGMEVDEPTEGDVAESDRDFDVTFFRDDQSMIEVSVSAVKCAAQMFYGMVLGDELGVFDAMNFFTHRYLIRGGIEIQDARLRDDLQMYVFSNRFTDLKTGRVQDRTRPAERQMFYRQVFNQGGGQVSRDLIVNDEFPRMWKVLILESAKYIERSQATLNPNSVSKQNVAQAVEDLQYNISNHCTGMASVITPLIYAELNFIVQRVFMHPEILRQIVPSGGTWWRVVETLIVAKTHRRPKSTVMFNKAKLGHDIIRSIAEYNPATFDDTSVFSNFISNVDAFITTQSILQEALTDDLVENSDYEEEEDYEEMDAPSPRRTNSSMNGVPAGSAGQEEWDF